MHELEARGLQMKFGGVTAIAGLDLTVEEGEIRGLIGPNGAGKTTFFNACSGRYPVTAGEELLVSARLPEELTAPLTAGQAVGELIVSMDGRELARAPLVCAEPVAAAEKKQSLFERLFDRTG